MTSRSPEHDARLLAAAEALATCGDLPALVRALAEALPDRPACVATGAGVHNPERELVEVHICGPAPAAGAAAWTLSESLRQAETDVPQLLSAGAGWLSYDLHDGRRSALYDALRDKGLRRVIVAAARLPSTSSGRGRASSPLRSSGRTGTAVQNCPFQTAEKNRPGTG